jgi:site-specific DNA-methyltransferase (adenine-specific)
MLDISREMFRILVPGAFYVSFSQARLYHRLGVAVEDAGFEIRDMLAWKYEGQAKAFSQDHFVRKMKISDEEKARIIADLGGRKTPQLKPQIEPMTLAQKPKQGTFVDNWLQHGTGLVDVSQSLDGMFPGNVMDVRKPSKTEKGAGNDHPTIKPVELISHLVKLFSKPGQTVIDPFMGSGSHGVACVESGRAFIGIERDPHYFDISSQRIKAAEESAFVEKNIAGLISF